MYGYERQSLCGQQFRRGCTMSIVGTMARKITISVIFLLGTMAGYHVR